MTTVLAMRRVRVRRAAARALAAPLEVRVMAAFAALERALAGTPLTRPPHASVLELRRLLLDRWPCGLPDPERVSAALAVVQRVLYSGRPVVPDEALGALAALERLTEQTLELRPGESRRCAPAEARDNLGPTALRRTEMQDRTPDPATWSRSRGHRSTSCALQLERLQWSLRHAYDNVPHYRAAFDAAGVHPRRLPVPGGPGTVPVHDQAGPARQLPVRDVRRSARAGLAHARLVGDHGRPTVVGYTAHGHHGPGRR